MSGNLDTSRLSNLFSRSGFHFSMKFQRGESAAFFADSENRDCLLEERCQWLNATPTLHAALLPEGAPLLEESIRMAEQWNSQLKLPRNKNDPYDNLLRLSRLWEPDFLLLKPTEDAMPRLVGGCVCFPSSWALERKVGESIDFIHATVPGLNESIGAKIRHFLNRLRPGSAWLRANWGLSRSPELNQHPDRRLPRLTADTPIEEIWLRVERQALTALPESGGVLFGIRIETTPLRDLKAHAEAAQGLARDLRSMPLPMARYKNIAAVRERIINWLTASI